MDSHSILRYRGSNFLRQRLVLATLSSKAVSISNISEDNENPGLKEYEAGLIRLLDKLTDGSRIEVNETGTSLLYQPGLLIGGSIEHNCSKQRSIGYYLEPLILLAPFMKKPARIVLRGITNGSEDPSVDYFRLCVLPMLKKILPGSDGPELKICQRGLSPDGNGEVIFSWSTFKAMKSIIMEDPGRVCRVRGVAYCVGVSPSMAGRMVDSVRGVLNAYLPDVYIHTDVSKSRGGGNSPGYGITVVAETTTGVMYSAETSCLNSATMLPEEVGRKTATELIENILKGGCFDVTCQTLPMMFMTLGEKNVSKVKLGEVSHYGIQFLRHIKDFFQLVFKVENNVEDVCTGEEDGNSLSRQLVSLTCMGIGYSNFNRPIL